MMGVKLSFNFGLNLKETYVKVLSNVNTNQKVEKTPN